VLSCPCGPHWTHFTVRRATYTPAAAVPEFISHGFLSIVALYEP